MVAPLVPAGRWMESGRALVARMMGPAERARAAEHAGLRRARAHRVTGGHGSRVRGEIRDTWAQSRSAVPRRTARTVGVFDALAMEMPLVELQPGEFFPIDERVVEGSTSSDQKLLLGCSASWNSLRAPPHQRRVARGAAGFLPVFQ
jgi:hypothetical protein